MKLIISIYYDLSAIFDDDLNMMVDAIKELTKTKEKRSVILNNMEFLRLHNIEEELNNLYDVKVKVLKAFRLRYIKRNKQTTIYDFL